jgi:hypothetical protein
MVISGLKLLPLWYWWLSGSGERLLAAQAAGMALWQNNSAVEEDNGRVMGSANDLSLLQAGPACPLAGIDMQSVLSAEQLRNLSRDEYCLLLSMLPEPDRRSNESLEALFSRQCFAHACQMLQVDRPTCTPSPYGDGHCVCVCTYVCLYVFIFLCLYVCLYVYLSSID